MEISTLFTFTTASVPSRICFCTANSGRKTTGRGSCSSIWMIKAVSLISRTGDRERCRMPGTDPAPGDSSRFSPSERRVPAESHPEFCARYTLLSNLPGPSHGTVSHQPFPVPGLPLAPERWGCHKHDWFLPVPWPSPSFHSSGAHPECRSYPKIMSIMRMSSSGVPTVI